jgi:hypothetical protein
MVDRKQCTYPGCSSATERPAADGWTWFEDLALGLPDGLYCPAHSAAIEAVISEGGLNDPDNDRGSPAGVGRFPILHGAAVKRRREA